MLEGGGEHRVGGPGEGAPHPLQRPGAGDVGERGGEQGPLLGRAQPGGEGAALALAAGGGRDVLKHILERGIGTLLGHDAKPGGVADDRLTEGGAVPEYAVEEGAGARLADEG